MKKICTILRSEKGTGYFDISVYFIAAMLVIAFFLTVAPIYTQKQQLDTFATQLCRTAEISGRVGEETSDRYEELCDQTTLSPEVSWSKTGNVQLGETVQVTLTSTAYIRIGGVANVPVTLTAKASGKSEVYFK